MLYPTVLYNVTLYISHGYNKINLLPLFQGYPLPYPGHYCAIMNGAMGYAWQSSTCNKKMGYVCYTEGLAPHPTDGWWKRFQSSISVSLKDLADLVVSTISR